MISDYDREQGVVHYHSPSVEQWVEMVRCLISDGWALRQVEHLERGDVDEWCVTARKDVDDA